ncbi:ATP-binding cassette domain-containing protein [Methanococcus maripaludis]|jgi:ABC-type lipoprotein export system ATPase subunit|uniref:ABC transporter ATP-binding protein n=3 Tax=Methanococcus maripaludis TaxID=39152 RepID=A0A8T3W4E0_METMI|nr:ATP-binding cassette domain-containing protein [Methanococcus maripaludis]AEK19166.1 ABC transporter ATPase [Methanococcus maripaludis X1]MBG0769485.1 ABC transporter ATP-binding protein [Methanococcus maripaludis]BAP62392.1 putative ABC transporter ATP-binding protein [Methanococcus maripaludis OS7]
MNIEEIKIMGGFNKFGESEKVKELVVKRGEIFGVVGPTGSGKSNLISDIEQLAQGDTPSNRKILVNGNVPDTEMRRDPRKRRIAQLSQNMNFLADMTVEEFLIMHAKSRGMNSEGIVDKVIKLANNLTGEPIEKDYNLTILSGGQSRSLMVADVAVISDSPIVLIDEIENAGIKKHEALELLAGCGKIVMVITHDPVLALMTTRRVVMRNGGMTEIIETTEEEKEVSQRLSEIDSWMLSMREKVRHGKKLNLKDIETPAVSGN